MSTDNKIVSMTFDARKFESGVNRTIGNVNKLNDSLKFPNAGKGFDDITKAANRVDLSHVAKAVDQVKYHFSALNVAASAIIAHISIQAYEASKRFAESFTIAPIRAGLQEYATNLNAIQTILANTQASGATLKDVNSALLDLNKYSDKTIYNFSEMARNIGTFTAAGVDLKTSTGAIKGIANLAALSGSNAEQASTAMYQLSQAISAGRVSLQDWNSVVNAGMGGTVFQRALATTAVSMGKLKESSLKLVGPMKNVSISGQSFRQSIQSGPGKQSWLTSDVLTKTLQQFTGDLTDAQLKAQGFNDAQIKAIQQTAKTALHAATEVKTLSQVFSVAQETAGSGWSQTFQLIFGNFGEAKKTFTELSNTINEFINANAHARNKILADWKKLGGRTILIETIKEAFKDLILVLKPIQKAFRDIFPRKSGRDLANLTVRLYSFFYALRPSEKTIDNLRRTFRGLFALLDIGKQIISGIITVFKQLFHSAGLGDGGFLSFTASIGDWLVSVDKALKKGNALHNFFVKMGVVIGAPIKLLSRFAGAIGNLFHGFSPGGVSRGVDGITKAMSPLQKVLHGIVFLWNKFIDAVKGTARFFVPDVDKIAEAFQELGPAISEALEHMNYEAILQTIRTGLFAALIIMMRNFFGSGGLFRLQSKVTIFSLMFKNVGYGIDALTGTLRAMQTNLKAKAILNIAIAVALLAASVVALSLADPKRVNAALASMTILFVELIYALRVLEKTSTTVGAAKIALLSGSLIALALAIDLLTLSVLALSRLSWDELTRGLTGVTVILAEMVILSRTINPSGMIRAGIGISAIAVGINIMALAIRQLGSMSLKELAKGLIAMDLSLGIIVTTLEAIPTKALLRTSISLNAIALALNSLALAVLQFGRMDLKTIAQGLVGIGASLVIIAKSMKLMPKKNLIEIAASLLLVSIALQGIARAVEQMGGMSMKEIAHGLVALAGALLFMGDAMNAMQSNIKGAIGLSIMAAGMALLTPQLILLGKQSWTTITKGLLAFAAAMGILVVASKFLDAVSLSLIGFGAALFLIGGAIALIGAGVALFGVGLSAVAVSGSAAIAVLMQAFNDFLVAMPTYATNIALGVLSIVQAFSETAPEFVDAMVKIIESLLDVIIRATPKAAEAIEVVLTAILKIIRDKQDDVIAAALGLILALLRGLKQNIKEIVIAAGDVVIQFLKGLATKAADIVTAGIGIILAVIKGIGVGAARLVVAAAKAFIRFLNAFADAITKYEPQILKAGARIALAIIQGMTVGLVNKNALNALWNKIKELTDKMIDKMHLGWLIGSPSAVTESMGKNIVLGFAKGIDKNKDIAVDSADKMTKAMVVAMTKNMTIAATGTFGKEAKGIAGTMEQLGQDIATSFAKGLRGSRTDINQAFTDLNQQLFDAASSARDTIDSENENIKQTTSQINEEKKKLNKLLKDPEKNKKAIADARENIAKSNKAIAESQHTIRQNQTLIDRVTAGHVELTKGLKDEKAQLTDLSIGYNKVVTQLDKAEQALADAKQARRDAFKDYQDQYDQLPDISSISPEQSAVAQVTAYERALEKQIEAVKSYQKTLDQLRKLGLDDTTYKKLLADGTIDQKFADALLAGGKEAVDEVNKLDSDLLKQSTSLAQSASSSLYDAGVAAAQGLVDGLKSAKSELADAIAALAKLMVKDIKQSLGIKSPSTVFAEIGEYVTKGMAKGLIESSKNVTDAVYMISDDAMGAMSKSLSNISSIVSENINPSPTITPILDLSEIQAGAKTINSILDKGSISVSASAKRAALIASQSERSVEDISPAASGGDIIKFEQNNYSPEALSDIDIYRNTKNLFSQHSRRLRGV